MTQIRTRIPAYAGQADANSRRLSDQQVRAWVGERLAALAERVPLDGASGAYDAVLTACEFGDQRVIKAIEDARFAEPERAGRVQAADARFLAAADDADAVDAAGVAAFIDRVASALHARNDTVVGLAPAGRRTSRFVEPETPADA